MTRPFLFRLLPSLLLRFLLLSAHLVSAAAASDTSEVKLVIILTRHGVRSPLQANQILGKYAAEPWPVWDVPPGILTPHGRQEMVMMGGYYRDHYTAEGLLSGNGAADAAKAYFHSDNDQRTKESALALASGLLPGAPAPELHLKPAGTADALYRPVTVHPKLPDRSLAVAALNGRIGNDPVAFLEAQRAEFDLLQQVLFGANPKPAGKVALLDLPVSVQGGAFDHSVGFEGPLHVGMQIVDALELEYAEGLPMAQVGWGRLTSAQLTQLLRLHSLYFGLTQGTFYPAQVQASSLAQRYLATIEQAASGRPVAGAFGTPAQSLVVVMGHDTNIANLGGLLGVEWHLPGTAANPLLPGGALVLELRQRKSDAAQFVRLSYVAQSLEQIRSLAPLTPQNPPGVAPIFVRGGSGSNPGYDVPLEPFTALLRRVIDPKFVLPDAL